MNQQSHAWAPIRPRRSWTNLISGEKEEEGHAELGHEVERLARARTQVEAVRSQDGARKTNKDDLGQTTRPGT